MYSRFSQRPGSWRDAVDCDGVRGRFTSLKTSTNSHLNQDALADGIWNSSPWSGMPMTSLQQTKFGEDISTLILLGTETESTEPGEFYILFLSWIESLTLTESSIQNASQPPTSSTPSLESIRKRKLDDYLDSSRSLLASKRQNKEDINSNSPTQPYIIVRTYFVPFGMLCW